MKKKLNILALSYLFPNKVQADYGIFVLNRLKAVQEFCNIQVIAPVQWYPLIRYFGKSNRKTTIPKKEKISGINVYHPRFFIIPRYLKWFDAISYHISVYLTIKKLAKESLIDFDIIDIHWTYPDILSGYLIARKFNKKCIITVRGREALYLEEKTLRRYILNTILKKTDYVITLSNELEQLVLAEGVSPKKTKTILNGVNLSSFFHCDRSFCRKKLGISLDKKIIISVGSLIERKGHHNIIAIMPKLLELFDVELYIIGSASPEGDFSQRLRALITALDLDKKIHVINHVEHKKLIDWYNAADIFCLATKGEGCPNVVLEALACGTPAIVTDVGATNEIIISGKNGFVVPNYAVNHSLFLIVHNALEWNWDRAQIASTMANRGWKKCAEKVVTVYYELTESNSQK